MLITVAEESKADLYSTIGVVIITILLQFQDKVSLLKYSDLIGTIIIGLIVIRIGLKIIVSNSLSLIGEVDIDEEHLIKIKDFLKGYKNIEKSKIELIKYGNYYKLNLELELNQKLTLRQVTNLENKLKKDITRHRSLNVKYVEIYVTSEMLD
jgi:divalent metal cation (Fe/Co/Zn/Cd) transporter